MQYNNHMLKCVPNNCNKLVRPGNHFYLGFSLFRWGSFQVILNSLIVYK